MHATYIIPTELESKAPYFYHLKKQNKTANKVLHLIWVHKVWSLWSLYSKNSEADVKLKVLFVQCNSKFIEFTQITGVHVCLWVLLLVFSFFYFFS